MAKELALKYGCNPNQKPARIFMQEGELPIEVLNGRPGYINFMDALNGWQLVKELKEATGMPAATSFKHVSPAGAAIGLELNETMKKIYFVDNLPLSPLACAYVRAPQAEPPKPVPHLGRPGRQAGGSSIVSTDMFSDPRAVKQWLREHR